MINIDYERAAINATIVIYPNTNIYSFLFHFSTNIYRWYKKMGFRTNN